MNNVFYLQRKSLPALDTCWDTFSRSEVKCHARIPASIVGWLSVTCAPGHVPDWWCGRDPSLQFHLFWGGDGQTACLAIRYTIFVTTLLRPFGLLIAAEHNNFPLQRNCIIVVILRRLVPDRLQGQNWIFPKRPQVGLEGIFSNTKCLSGADMVRQDSARLPSARYGQSDYSRWTDNHLKVKFGQACFKDKLYNTWFQVLLPE